MKIEDNPFYDVFKIQQNHQFEIAKTSYKERRRLLNALRKAIEVTYREAIIEALKEDLGKPRVEAEMTEIYQMVGDIKYAKKNLKQWMKPQRVETPLSLLGSSSRFIYEPKGVCLIISPWNFPFNLTFGPLISAIAAGNTAIVKPSEITSHSAEVIQTIIENVFETSHVAVVQGDAEVATHLLKLPFNHIFFTGSPQIGKIVMSAAAKHLTSVTLELGGKSPTVVHSSADIDAAAKKIIWAKYMNCGQICVSPDYVLLDNMVKDKFITACKKWIEHYYDGDPKSSAAYGKIVSQKHFDRLESYLDDAKAHNAKIEYGGETDKTRHYISPTMVLNLPEESLLLNEEIFGPILPVVTYNTVDEAIRYINTKKRPLALYIYAKNKSVINDIITHTRAGGTCINNSILQYANHHLPFGGINNSGIGKSHGFFGFKAFSNERSILKQHTYGISELLFPPYSDYKEKLARLTIKWF